MRLRATRGGSSTGQSTTPLDPVVVTYLAAVQAAGGALSPEHAQAHSGFVAETKAGGYWSKLREVGTFAGGTPGVTLAGVNIPLKTTVGLTSVLNNFVAADLTSKGLKSTTTNKWVNTRVPVSALPNTGYCGLGVFLTEERSTNAFGMLIGSAQGSDPQLGIFYQNDTNGNLEVRLNGFGRPEGRMQHRLKKIAAGLYHGERGSNTIRMFAGGAIVDTRTSTFTYTSSAQTIGVLGMGDGGLAMDGTVGMYFISDGTLTDAEAGLLAIACNRLMVRLGRMVPARRRLPVLPAEGQSLARGANGTPVASTTQPYGNLMASSSMVFGNPGDIPQTFLTGLQGDGAHLGVLMGMVEFGEETMISSFANTVSMMARAAGMGDLHDMLSHNFAIGGTPYSGLAKGTNAYANSIEAIDKFKVAAALYASLGVFVPAVLNVHMESNMADTNYGSAAARPWQSDFETDIRAKTGQVDPVPMIHSQASCWTAPGNINSATGAAPFSLAAEAKLNPLKTLIACAKYFFAYSDGVHLTTAGYRRLGAYYAKAYFQHVILGIPWVPLRPASVTRSGANIDIVFEGCVGNLVLDTSLVTDPSGASNTKGVEYRDDTIGDGAQRYTSIGAVSILTQSPPTVRVSLGSNPGAALNKRIRGGFTGIAGNSAGPTTGPRLCIRDSDTRLGYYGESLENYCLHFDEPVT